MNLISKSFPCCVFKKNCTFLQSCFIFSNRINLQNLSYSTQYLCSWKKYLCPLYTYTCWKSCIDYRIKPITLSRLYSNKSGNLDDIQSRLSFLQAKKRVHRKKKFADEDSDKDREISQIFTSPMRPHTFTYDPDLALPQVPIKRPHSKKEWQVTAYATADEYNLPNLFIGLKEQELYEEVACPDELSKHHGTISSHGPADSSEVLHMTAKYPVSSEPREIYFFSEGSVVFWNIPQLERINMLEFLEAYEIGPYDDCIVEEESESLTYSYSNDVLKTKLIHDRILFGTEGPTHLEKYTFSNVMTMSVKLGIWEASLDSYIDNIEYVSEELSKTGKVVLSQPEVLQRMGQLFALRHLINLSSDLLDTPDFYWDHEELEHLYNKVCSHLSIPKRTSVMNTKLNHCIELMELLKSHLSEKHSARLEIIIILLILIEVVFELLHFL